MKYDFNYVVSGYQLVPGLTFLVLEANGGDFLINMQAPVCSLLQFRNHATSIIPLFHASICIFMCSRTCSAG